MNKKCTKCGEVKPSTLFPKDKNRKNGHHPWCKECLCNEMNKYRNTERGYLRMRYNSMRGRELSKDKWGRKSKCFFTFDEFLTAFDKHKSIYGMRSAWGPGPDHLEEHLPITMIQEGKGRRKRYKRIPGNLSPDRLDPNLDYTLQNIIFIRSDENHRKNATRYEDCKIQIKLHEQRFIDMKSI